MTTKAKMRDWQSVYEDLCEGRTVRYAGMTLRPDLVVCLRSRAETRRGSLREKTGQASA
jgi:hypothetical protein